MPAEEDNCLMKGCGVLSVWGVNLRVDVLATDS